MRRAPSRIIIGDYERTNFRVVPYDRGAEIEEVIAPSSTQEGPSNMIVPSPKSHSSSIDVPVEERPIREQIYDLIVRNIALESKIIKLEKESSTQKEYIKYVDGRCDTLKRKVDDLENIIYKEDSVNAVSLSSDSNDGSSKEDSDRKKRLKKARIGKMPEFRVPRRRETINVDD